MKDKIRKVKVSVQAHDNITDNVSLNCWVATARRLPTDDRVKNIIRHEMFLLNPFPLIGPGSHAHSSHHR
tara:strand:+ start:11 stop:220 length:210 start_codon:yes stop_codon:yes gene_type:complete